MSDQSFIAHFITEDIYLLKEEVKPPTQTDEAKPEPLVEQQPAQEPVAEEVATYKEEPALFEPSKVEEPEPVYLKPLPTEGSNLKHCLVLVESENQVLENELKGLLEKIMTAVKRSMDDILLVNVKAASDDQLDALLSEQNHRHLLAFGTRKVQQLREVGNYELTLIERRSYVKADSLRSISENIELKKALWKVLKEMF